MLPADCTVKGDLGLLDVVFLLLKTRSLNSTDLINLSKFWSCSLWKSQKAQISSWIVMMFGNLLVIWSILNKKIPWLLFWPKDILKNLYMPLWELNLFNVDTPKTIFASTFEKIFAFLILGKCHWESGVCSTLAGLPCWCLKGPNIYRGLSLASGDRLSYYSPCQSFFWCDDCLLLV